MLMKKSSQELQKTHENVVLAEVNNLERHSRKKNQCLIGMLGNEDENTDKLTGRLIKKRFKKKIEFRPPIAQEKVI